jgi:glycogen(starch) synthase
MKILFVSNLYPPNAVGGYERLCAAVAAAFVTRGHDVTVLTSCYGASVSRHAGQVVHQAMRLLIDDSIYADFVGTEAQRAATNRANVAAAKRVIDETRPEAIYCWNLYRLDRSLLDALAASSLPLLVMLTDNWLLNAQNPGFIAQYFREQVFAPHNEASVLTQPPPERHVMPFGAIFGAAYMRELYRLGGITFRRDAVVHNGVHQELPDQARFQNRTTTVHPGELNLLFAGRIVDIKGVHTAIEAMPALQNLCGPQLRVRLTIVGDVQDQAYLKRLSGTVTRCGCTEVVTFLPQVAESALFELFQAHDIYLFPSLYEPFSLTLILAMAAGIPTAASRVGGNVEIVHENESGLLFERGDSEGLARAVARLGADPALRERLSAGGRKMSAKFTFSHMVERMDCFITELVANVH